MDMQGYLSRNELLGSFLLPRLRREDITPAGLCRRLGLLPTQLAQWSKGHDPIPGHHMLALKEALRLSDTEFVTLSYLNSLLVARTSLDRLVKGGRTSRSVGRQKGQGLPTVLPDGSSVVRDILRYCEFLAGEDLRTLGGEDWPKALYLQVEAALRVAKDLNDFLNEDSGDLFSAKNILVHLRYPYNYHFGFYLNSDRWSGPPPHARFAELVWEGLSQASRLLGTDDALQNRIAQHATHLISRYGSGWEPPAPRQGSSNDLETRRMALFGEVYRKGDTGDFEKLVHPIVNNPEFSDLVLAFDAMHYGDYRLSRESLDRETVPINAIIRHVAGIGSEKIFLRKLSSARLAIFLERYSDPIEADPILLRRVGAARAALDDRVAWGKEEQQVVDRIDGLSRRFERGGVA